MKKGKVFSKRHIVTATLVLCLAAAVWLNMKYSSFTSPLTNDSASGDKDYYDTSSQLGQAVETSGKVATIQNTRKERNDTRSKAITELKATLEKADIDAKVKSEALKKLETETKRITDETTIETVVKTKGFDDALVMISDESVTVIVPKDQLLTSETLQIQDAVTSQIKIDLEKIKIITLK